MDTAAPSNEPAPSPRSLRSLDGLNFLMADVRDGLGPYLSVFLKSSQHWKASPIGVRLQDTGRRYARGLTRRGDSAAIRPSTAARAI